MYSYLDAVLWPWRAVQLFLRLLFQLLVGLICFATMPKKFKKAKELYHESECDGVRSTAMAWRTRFGRTFHFIRSSASVRPEAVKSTIAILPPGRQKAFFSRKNAVEHFHEAWIFKLPSVSHNNQMIGLPNMGAVADIQIALARKVLKEPSCHRVAIYGYCNNAKTALAAGAHLLQQGEKRFHVVVTCPMYKWSLHLLSLLRILLVMTLTGVSNSQRIGYSITKRISAHLLSGLAFLVFVPVFALFGLVMGEGSALADWKKLPSQYKSLSADSKVDHNYSLYQRLLKGKRLGERYFDAIQVTAIVLPLLLAVNAWVLPMFTSFNSLTWASAATGLSVPALIGCAIAGLVIVVIGLDFIIDCAVQPWTLQRIKRVLEAANKGKNGCEQHLVKSILKSNLLPREVSLPLNEYVANSDLRASCLQAALHNLQQINPSSRLFEDPSGLEPSKLKVVLQPWLKTNTNAPWQSRCTRAQGISFARMTIAQGLGEKEWQGLQPDMDLGEKADMPARAVLNFCC